jgi:hypothetical protein
LFGNELKDTPRKRPLQSSAAGIQKTGTLLRPARADDKLRFPRPLSAIPTEV